MYTSHKIVKSIVVLFAVVILQLVIALVFFYPYFAKWGATNTEIAMTLPGDDYAEEIVSTRTISIAKPKEEVWGYLTALGADRNGFYSYSFLEYLFGCTIENYSSDKRYDIKLNRLVPIQSADASGNYTVGFSVIDIMEGESFVLDGWGTFYLKKIDNTTCKLIVRSHAKTATSTIEKIGFPIFDLMHYVMEKRMLLGTKDIAETNGKNYTKTTDFVWLISVFLLIIIGFVFVFSTNNWLKILVPNTVLLIAQFFILVLNPTFYLSLFLVAILLLLFILMFRKRCNMKK